MAKAKQAFLPQDDYANQYYQMQKQARLFWLPINEYERLAAGKLRSDLAPNIPKVNDNTLASMLLDIPKRVAGQIFEGAFKVVESIDPKSGKPAYPQPWVAELINQQWKKVIVPHANTQAPFLQKMQLSMYRALIQGHQPIFNFFTKRGDKRIADFSLPYFRDVYLEVGKNSDLDSDYIMMDSYYSRLQLAQIIAKANDAEAVGVKSPWNLKELTKIYNSHIEQQKDYLAKNQAERNRPVMAEWIKFTTVFQRGVGAPFDTFYMPGSNEGNLTVVRTQINTDPTGDIPIHYLYAYEDLVNPYGKGLVELAGGTQNVLDYMTQLHILANQIGLQPPILVQGDRSMTDLDSMIYSPSQFWFTGGAEIDIMETSSSILKEFPSAYQLYKSQLVGMYGTTMTDVPSDSDGVSQGKTPAAIAKNQARELASDAYLRRRMGETYTRVFRSMINIWLANMQGKDVLRLEADDAMRLTRTGLIPANPKTGQPISREVEMDWSKLNGHIDVELDDDSAVVKDDAEQVQKLMEILEFVGQNPYMLQYINSTGYELNLGEVYAEILTHMGLNDIEKILEPLSEQDQELLQTVPPMVFDKPKLDVKYSDLPPVAQLQMLQRLGYQVQLQDVLAGPVLDPNISNIKANTGDPGAQQPIANPNIPQSPNTFQEAVDPRKTPDAAQTAASPGASDPMAGLQPETAALINQVMQEKGVPANVAKGIIEARARGYDENQIEQFLKGNVRPMVVKNRAPQPPQPAPSGPPVPMPAEVTHG